VELEIENTNEDAAEGMRGFKVERDGSLRNNGLEFITYPMRYNVLCERLEKFFANNEFNESNYSERCSVHVHANCRDLTFDQVASIVLIYQVVEKLLFNFIGDDRDKNIFCVPLSETSITYRLVKRLSDNSNSVLRDWNKYTALNLLPLTSPTQGTIEFRHMGGTHNVEFIKTWLRMICRIFAAVRTTGLATWIERLSGLNSNSQYAGILVDIFKDESTYLITPGYESLLEEGVLLLKYSLMGEDKKIKGLRATTMVMDDLAHRDAAGPSINEILTQYRTLMEPIRPMRIHPDPEWPAEINAPPADVARELDF